MNLVRLVKAVCARPSIREIMGPLQVQAFQHDFVPRDPNAKSKRFKYPQVYDPYGPRPPPSDKVVELRKAFTSVVFLNKKERMLISYDSFRVPEYSEKYVKPEDIVGAEEVKSSDEKLSEDEYAASEDEEIAGKIDL
ncbi:hypothetical protein GOBAR_DD06759 [Gossypium barbadense]|nr:hypothetical protein GOBAR_DD06759 [Gossypium barbadense]